MLDLPSPAAVPEAPPAMAMLPPQGQLLPRLVRWIPPYFPKDEAIHDAAIKHLRQLFIDRVGSPVLFSMDASLRGIQILRDMLAPSASSGGSRHSPLSLESTHRAASGILKHKLWFSIVHARPGFQHRLRKGTLETGHIGIQLHSCHGSDATSSAVHLSAAGVGHGKSELADLASLALVLTPEVFSLHELFTLQEWSIDNSSSYFRLEAGPTCSASDDGRLSCILGQLLADGGGGARLDVHTMDIMRTLEDAGFVLKGTTGLEQGLWRLTLEGRGSIARGLVVKPRDEVAFILEVLHDKVEEKNRWQLLNVLRKDDFSCTTWEKKLKAAQRCAVYTWRSQRVAFCNGPQGFQPVLPLGLGNCKCTLEACPSERNRMPTPGDLWY